MRTSPRHRRATHLLRVVLVLVCLASTTAAAPSRESAPALAAASGCCIGPGTVSVVAPDWTLRELVREADAVTHRRTGIAPVWSADGRRLTYVSAGVDGTRVSSVRVDGTGLRHIVTVPGEFPSDMDRAPGDGWIALSLFSPCVTWGCLTVSHVVLVRPDGRILVPLGPGAGATWSPVRSRLAYHAGGRLLLVDVGPTGPGKPVDVTPSGITVTGGVRWSPDGRQLAFQAVPLDREIPSYAAPELWVAHADRSAARRLRAATWASVDWSPDGSRLVFADRGLHTVPVDGTRGPRTILADEAIEGRAMWSPDGRWIAVSRSSDRCCTYPLLLVHPDGSGMREVGLVTAWPQVTFRPAPRSG